MNISAHLISHLPYFDALHRMQSFTKAAEQLHVTQTAMSYQIKQLESKLNQSLVVRQPGSRLRFTAAGQTLAQAYRQASQSLVAAIDEMKFEQGRGCLRLSTSVDFGSVIAPRMISALKRIAPKLEIEIHSSDEDIDLQHSRWELAIQASLTSSQSSVFQSPLYLLASLDYVKHNGSPRSLNELGQHTILMREGSQQRSWNALLAEPPQFANNLILGNTLGMREAARAGLGIALLPQFVVESEIRRGELIKLLPRQTREHSVFFNLRQLPGPQFEHYADLIRSALKEV
jgi:LysR family glycine cleavage system transcriptional activator